MSHEQICHRCGELIPFGEPQCPKCATRAHRPLRPGIAIALLVMITASLFVITYFVARAYQKKQRDLAVEWFERGERDYHGDRVQVAIEDYRTALAYAPDEYEYRLRLAEALDAAGRPRQSRAYLLALWDERPGDGTINLHLARMSARSGDENDALRYFHGAIYGLWDDNPEQHRRMARVELTQFLLQRKRVRLAEAELIQLSVDMPRDAGFLTQAGNMFLQAGDAERALSTFRSALELEHDNAAAMAGAARSAFLLRQYREAEPLLRRAVATNPQDASLAAQLKQDEFIVQFSPYEPRLSAADRSTRVQHLLDTAMQRLQSCAQQRLIDLTAVPPQNDLQADALQVREVRPALNAKGMLRNPDLQDVAMDLIARIEADTAKSCGAPSVDDQAITLILAQRERA